MSDHTGGMPPASPAAPAAPPAAALEITAGATPSPAISPTPGPSTDPGPAAPPVADPPTPAAPEPAPAAPAEPKPADPAAEPAKPPEPAKPGPEADQPVSALSTKPEEPKPGDAPKPGEPPAPEAPVGYEFTMPEGVDIPKPELAPFVDTLREHGITPQAGQKLLDMYVERMQQLQTDTLANQWKQFAETRTSELNRVKADPELGGAGYETTRAAAARGRDLLLGTDPAHVAEYERFVANTGAGEQLALWRIFVNADRLWRESKAPPVPPTPPSNARGNGPRRGVSGLFRNPSGR